MTAPARVERVYTPRILAVFGATMLYFGVAGVAFPVLPRLVERELGGGSAEIGLAFGVWAIGMLVVRPFGGYMLDLIGRRWGDPRDRLLYFLLEAGGNQITNPAEGTLLAALVVVVALRHGSTPPGDSDHRLRLPLSAAALSADRYLK